MAKIRVEVVRALPEAAQVVKLSLPAGSTVLDAVVGAGLPAEGSYGIFGRRVSAQARLREGDRVELYRPLFEDPKEARRRRARRRR
jgi:uncharacterized protein